MTIWTIAQLERNTSDGGRHSVVINVNNEA